LGNKSRRHSLLIVTIILLTVMSIFVYFQFFGTTVEPQKALMKQDTDTNLEKIASVSKSTMILIICIAIVGLLGGHRKKDSSGNLSVKGTK